MSWLRRGAALAAVGMLALAACGGDDDDATTTDAPATTGAATTAAPTDTAPATAGGEADKLVLAIQSPPAALDNATGIDIPTRRISTVVVDRLLSVDNTGKPIPWIAESFANPDPLTWTFTLRDGVNFWDGQPLTIDDAVWSLQRHVGPDTTSMAAQTFMFVDSVTATDAKTITVKLQRPDPSFPVKAANDWFIQEKAYGEAAGADLGGPDKPGMSTGPYTVTSFSSADGAVLERNDNYWGPKPKIKTIEFKVISDPDTARLAMQSGEIDGFFDVPLIATRQWDTLDNTDMIYVDGTYNDFLSMNVTKAPFDDPKVREAVSHLVDVQGLLGPLFNDRATAARSVVPAMQMKTTLGEQGTTDFFADVPAVPGFSIDDAKAALAASTHTDGFSTDLLVDTTQPWMSPLAQSMAENAKQIGITINVKPVSTADWVADLTNPEGGNPLQLAALGASTTWPGELAPALTNTQSGFNLAHWGDATTDETVATVATASDVDELLPPLKTLLTSLATDLPYVPLFDEQTATALSKKFVWEGGYTPFEISQMWILDLGAAG